MSDKKAVLAYSGGLDTSAIMFWLAERDYEIHWDDTLKGFGVRVTGAGVKSYILTYGKNKKRKRVTIGRVGVVKLAEARDKAKNILADHQLHGEKIPSITFEKAREMFIDVYCTQNHRPSTALETKRLLHRHFKVFEGRDLADIETREIAVLIDKLLILARAALPRKWKITC